MGMRVAEPLRTEKNENSFSYKINVFQTLLIKKREGTNYSLFRKKKLSQQILFLLLTDTANH